MISYEILYIGDANAGCTSRHRYEALRRLGHNVTFIPTHKFSPLLGKAAGKIDYLTGHRFRQAPYLRRLKSLMPKKHWDVVWVDSGWWCGPQVADHLATRANRMVLLCCDDPFGPREPLNWASLRGAVRHFDLCVTFREPTATDFQRAGARNVLRLRFGYDEVAHDPSQAEQVGPSEFQGDVAFIGSRMEDRHEFLIGLIRRGIPLSIWGNGWQGRAGWSVLRKHWRGPVIGGPQYVAAIQRSKVCLGLLSKLNRDLHTQRSCEIPFAGGLLCAKRTSEHSAMYIEGEEAVFWNDVDECAAACHRLLGDAALRERIVAAGSARVRQLRLGNEQLVGQVLDELYRVPEAPLHSRAAGNTSLVLDT